MLLYLVYFLIIFFSNTVGALSGMGGGVIIKPALDTLGAHPLATIGFYSSVAVFTMSIVSIIKQMRGGFRIQWNLLVALALGAILGGAIGDVIFTYLMGIYENPDLVNLIQIIIMIITLGGAIMYMNSSKPTIEKKGFFWYFVVTLFLGIISTLLGIGGGPINVAVFMFIFGQTTKQAAVQSIFTIFFSQISKLTATAISPGFATFDTTFLMVIIPAAILGGYIGSGLNQSLSDRKVDIAYQIITTSVLLLNVYNGITIIL